MQQKFEATLAKVPMRQIYSARLERDEAADYVREAQVWFWRFRPEYRAEVERRQPELDRAQARLDELEAERDAIMVEARQVVGIWSEVRGVRVLVIGVGSEVLGGPSALGCLQVLPCHSVVATRARLRCRCVCTAHVAHLP